MTSISTRALIYCRVSDTKQKIEGSGLDSQEFRCRQYAAENGYAIDKIFHDDVSGGGDFAKRPGMIALLSYLEKNQKTGYVVIFDDLKRLARDTMFHWQLRHAISNFGARVECLNYKFDDSPEGEFVETLFAAQSQLERKQIGRQTRQKTQARLEAGYHAFTAPAGYYFKKTKTQGKILLVDEVVAPAIREAMEGFATGRFQTKTEVQYFLESCPEFPKHASGKLGNTRVDKMLRNPLYAGYIEYRPWGVSLRKGQHEGIISFEAFKRIQDRLEGRAYAPTRKDLNRDFPLRGVVACECGNAMTACWSKSSTGKYHAYYLCQNRQCEYKGKSIRRDVIEGEFETLLKQLTPTRNLIAAASDMFKTLWKHREATQQTRRETLKQERDNTQRKMDQLLDRIVEADSPLVSKALEKKVDDLQSQKLVIEEKISNCGRPIKTHNEMYRTALQFLQEPHKLWINGRFEDKRAVLKLAFTDYIIWDRKGLYRTPDLSLPFKLLGDDFTQNMQVVPRGGIEPP